MENEKGIVKLTRKQLYDEIWALSVAGVARKYNLNYGKLIATCKVENISFPSSGYWTKKNMGKDVSNEIVEFSGLEDTEISLITKDAVVKRIRKAKAEVVEKVHTDVTEELDVVTEEDLPQKKTDNIPEWPDGILDYLDETERNKVLEYACNLQISQSTRLHKMLVQYNRTCNRTWKRKISVSIKVNIERVLMPFAKMSKTNRRTDILPNLVAVFRIILYYKSVTKYRRTRHTFAKSNGLYAMS